MCPVMDNAVDAKISIASFFSESGKSNIVYSSLLSPDSVIERKKRSCAQTE